MFAYYQKVKEPPNKKADPLLYLSADIPFMRFTIIYDNHTFNLAGSYIFSEPFSVCAFLTMREFFPCTRNNFLRIKFKSSFNAFRGF